MATAKELLDRLDRLNLDQCLQMAIKDTIHLVPDLQRKQLDQGLGADGKLLTPSILQDPHFGTPQQAHAYAVWKKDVIGSKAPFGYADLYINGYTHYNIFAVANAETLSIGIDVPWSADLDQKYRGMHLGLTDASVLEYRAPLMQQIRRHIRIVTSLP